VRGLRDQAVGEQRCDDCGAFMRRVGLGGTRPHCDEAVSVVDLLGEAVGRLRVLGDGA
jgi:hypothetical protein